MNQASCFNAMCRSRAILNHVTGRWGGLVLGALGAGTRRYSELRRQIDGISEKMLAQTLRDLERDGLVTRRQYPTVPPRVDYTLTPAGAEVAARLVSLMSWIEANVAVVQAANERHDGARGDEALLAPHEGALA
jgi:DNA-binding HxlR family transcriptional regulator